MTEKQPKRIVVGDVVGIKTWGCTGMKVSRINYLRRLVWIVPIDPRPGLSVRATQKSFDDIETVNYNPFSEGERNDPII